MKFEKVELKHKEIFEKYTTGYINEEASFANIMMWNGGYFVAYYTICCDTLVINFANLNGKQRFSMPYGSDDNIMCAVNYMAEYCKEQNMPFEIIDGNSNFVDIVKNSGKFHIEYTQNRDYQEYVYLTESLATLSGKDLHSKKNHLNKFRSLYDYRFVPMDVSVTDLCLNKAKQWLDTKYNGNADEYKIELDSLYVALNNFDYFNLFGGCIFVGDELAAFTVGEERSADTALVHIEKADVSYKGAFAAINCEFANMLLPKYKYLNREEDMGIEGLRRAKLSYKPAFMTDKYRCTIKGVD